MGWSGEAVRFLSDILIRIYFRCSTKRGFGRDSGRSPFRCRFGADAGAKKAAPEVLLNFRSHLKGEGIF